MFGDANCTERCAAKLGGRWAGIRSKWGEWEGTEASVVGGKIGAVVEKLVAPHLRATSILNQLNEGNDAAAFGLATLVTNMAQ